MADRDEFNRYWLARQRARGFGTYLTDEEMLAHPERKDEEFHAWQAGRAASPPAGQTDPFDVKARTPYEMGFADGYAKALARHPSERPAITPSQACSAWNDLLADTDGLGEVGVRIMRNVRVYAQRQYEAGRSSERPAPEGQAVEVISEIRAAARAANMASDYASQKTLQDWADRLASQAERPAIKESSTTEGKP